ncbi:hypothetical protein VM1G_04688 [Cytospora mali]|uniref:Uncharacterized protein n=1 Tax=Cytospora mali TaxID=578113 RepID=A0A194VWD0_CYTMA|nr:hypothetical protein VM1G_04688 [Valsa mali]
MMATVVRALRRYIAPFYPVDAEEQARLQRYFLGETIDEAANAEATDGPDVEIAEATKRNVDVMKEELKKITRTVDEMERHLIRCRNDLDDLFSTWSDDIARQYSQRLDEKVAEFDEEVERLSKQLEHKFTQAGQSAAVHMQGIVDEHNAEVQHINKQLEGKLADVKEKVGEKAEHAEVAMLTTAQSCMGKRLAQFQREQKMLHERQGGELVHIMRDQKRMYRWMRAMEKEHNAIALHCEADAKARCLLHRRLDAIEQQPRVNQISSQALISMSRDLSAPQGTENGSCPQLEAKVKELMEKLEDYQSRLNTLERAPINPSPCQSCEETLKKVEKIELKLSEASEAKKELQSLKGKFEDYKNFSDARYEALEVKFVDLVGLVNRPQAPPVDWEMVARLEALEEEQRWNDRVRQLETFGTATPEPVLKHMEYLETRLGIELYEREIPLPGTIARFRIAWAWDVLEGLARTDAYEDVKDVELGEDEATSHEAAPVQHQPLPAIIEEQQTQQPGEVHVDSTTQQFIQGEALEEPTVQVTIIPKTNAHEDMTQQATAQMDIVPQEGSPAATNTQCEVEDLMVTTDILGHPDQTDFSPPAAPSFSSTLPNFQPPPVNVPAMDWSASVSVDLSRKASEFDIDDPSRSKAPKNRDSAKVADTDVADKDIITTASFDAGESGASGAIEPSTNTKSEVLTQDFKNTKELQEHFSHERKISGLGTPSKENVQSPFSIIPSKKSDSDLLTVPDPKTQSEEIAQPIYGGSVSSAYTTVYGSQPVTNTMASPSNTGFCMTPTFIQPPPPPNSSNVLSYSTPIYSSPTNPNSRLATAIGPYASSTQQPPRSLTSSGLVSYTPAQPILTNPNNHLAQSPTVSSRTGSAITVLAPLAQTQLNDTDSDGDVDGNVSETEVGTVPVAENNARAVRPKPKGRLNRMTDRQREEIRLEVSQQAPKPEGMQALPPIISQPSMSPEPTEAAVQETETTSTYNKVAKSSKISSATTAVYDREDTVDYGDTDDDTPAPPKPPAATAPTAGPAERKLCRYSTQWLKIWRSHVVSEQNLTRFAEASGFGKSADKWVATVENANADIRPQDLLGHANIGVKRQLYSRDDINDIAGALFEVCLVQSGSFKRAVENFDPFDMAKYHEIFMAAFKEYLESHPADSF